jgi:hypothetical protein
MDFGRIVNMILNTLLRRAVNTGINKGIKHMSAKGAPKGAAPHSNAREITKRARQAARITRKMGR